MQQRSVGQRIWRLLGPLIVKFVVAFVVETVVIMLYIFIARPDLFQSVSSQEEVMQKGMEVTGEILQYATEISALSALFTIPILAFMFHKDRKNDVLEQVIPRRKLSWKKYALAVGISIPFALGMNNLLLLSSLPMLSEAYQSASKTLYTPSLPMQILCIGIIIPIMEELIFRGLIFRRLRETMSAVPAIIYSAVFFGVYHGNLVQMIYGFACGLLLSYVYEKFGSLKLPVLMHMAMNILACVLTELGVFMWILQAPLRVGIVTAVCALAASGIFIWIKES